jgi:hypothetical protein
MKKLFLLFFALITIINCSKKDDDIINTDPDPDPTEQNEAPLAVNDTITTQEDISVLINVLLNDSDPDNNIDPTTVVVETGATDGTTTVDAATGAITYTPNPEFVGTDTFTYKVCDDGNPSLCDTATVSVRVLAANGDVTPPCVMVENLTYSQTNETITLSWNPCVDPNGEEVTYSIILYSSGYDCYLNAVFYNINEEVETTETTYTFNDKLFFVKYWAVVTAKDPAGNTSEPTNVYFNSVPIGTYTGDIELNYQYEVDVFEDNQLDVLNGNIIIGQPCRDFGIYVSTPISDLSPLSGIKVINGDVILKSYGWHNFHNLEGFEEVTKIGGKLRIEGENNRGFINDISQLSNLTELHGFQMIGNSIPILEGFNNISQDFNSSFILENNFNLTAISAFQNVPKILGNFNVIGNSNLQSFSGFNQMNQFNGDVIISNNSNLNSFSGLNNINTANFFQIKHCEELININAFQNLNTTNYFEIGFSGLENVNMFQDLTQVANELTINNNQILQNTNGFTNLGNIGERITFINNNSLQNISFNSIQYDSSNPLYIYLVNNPSLTNISGFEDFNYLKDIYLENNQNLSSLNTFQNLSKVYYTINLRNNDALTNLDFLSNLELIECDNFPTGSDLTITGNFSLGDFCGLRDFFTNNGLCSQEYLIEGNGYNPTHLEIINGDCSL